MELKLEKTATSYSVEVDTDAFLALTRWERKNWDEPHLNKVLEAIEGVNRVEYDGHFGARIMFDIHAEQDTEATHAAVKAAIAGAMDDALVHAVETDRPGP